ncbi:MAG TPA: ABC transporter permease [Bryobacteraceae bacterium]|nr:ABC transporter permease [Bryobacteraceae bacterium]
MTLRSIWNRLLALTRKQQLDRELEQEVLAHLEAMECNGIANGLTPEAARAAAYRKFGGIEAMKEDHRDRRSFTWLEALLRDVRYGLMALRREPGFASVVIGVLALGIGANVAMFSVLDAVLLRPLPFPQPDRIVRVWDAPRPGVVNATTTPDFLEWQAASRFEALSAERDATAALAGDGNPVRLIGKEVTADYFRVFGVKPVLGRTWTSEEERVKGAPMVVLSHAAWQTWFGGAPDILQRRPVLGGEPQQVVGVLASGAFDRDKTAFWKPLILERAGAERNIHWLTVYGRLKPDASYEAARQQLKAMYAARENERSVNNRGGAVEMQSLARVVVGPGLERTVYVAFGAVALVLLIACANVANLLLARGAVREREMAARAALGAGRSRLVAQLLTETLVLSLLGAIAGLAGGALLIRALTPALVDILPFTAQVVLDLRLLAFVAAVAVVVCLIAGSVPAIQNSRSNLVAALNRGSRGSSGAHAATRRFIVISEVALSLVLVCGAVLLFRSLSNLSAIESGIRIEDVTTASMDLPERAYPTPERAAQFYEALSARLRQTPGITNAGLASHMPLVWIGNGEGIQVSGFDKLVRVRLKRVDSEYFSTLGIPVLQGRGITERDRLGGRSVLVINQALLTRLKEVPGMGDPIGKVVRLSQPAYGDKNGGVHEVEVVGVIRSERVAAPGTPDPPVAYVSLAQTPSSYFKIFVRSPLDTAAAATALREAARAVDPALQIDDIRAMRQVRQETLSGTSRPAWVIGAFACVAALLAAIGLYGVLSQAVRQRRRELGIRVALGAGPRRVLTEVLNSAAGLILVGLALGLLCTVALTRVIVSLLYEVSPLDPISLFAGSIAMLAVGLLAALLPASRAARLDPLKSLREEG